MTFIHYEWQLFVLCANNNSVIANRGAIGHVPSSLNGKLYEGKILAYFIKG